MSYRVTYAALYYRTDDPRERLVHVIVTGPAIEVAYFFRSAKPEEQAAGRSRAIFDSASDRSGRPLRRRVGFCAAARAAEERLELDDGRGAPAGELPPTPKARRASSGRRRDVERGDPAGLGCAGPCL